MGNGLGRSEVLQRTVPQTEKRAESETATALNMDEVQIMSSPKIPLTTDQVDRIIQMAWQDRTTFDAIRIQFNLNSRCSPSTDRGLHSLIVFQRIRMPVHKFPVESREWAGIVPDAFVVVETTA